LPGGRFRSSIFEIVVQPFPSATGKWPASTGGGTQARWSPDGKELYFVAPDRKLMAVRFAASGLSPDLGKPFALFSTLFLVAGGSSFVRSMCP
jgi:hypothetical protein